MENDKKYEKVRATMTYKSGRKETIHGKLKGDQTPHKTFSKRVSAFRSFPTVTNVEIEKY